MEEGRLTGGICFDNVGVTEEDASSHAGGEETTVSGPSLVGNAL